MNQNIANTYVILQPRCKLSIKQKNFTQQRSDDELK